MRARWPSVLQSGWTIRFHSRYTDAAGNIRAQFCLGPGPDARARVTDVRGEICLDVRRSVVTLENVSRNLTREEEVALMRAWHEQAGHSG